MANRRNSLLIQLKSLKDKHYYHYNPLTVLIQKIILMDKIRQKKWFSITAYVMAFWGVWALGLYWAETFFPNQPSNLIPNQSDRISGRRSSPPGRQNSQKSDAAKIAAQEKLFLLLNQKHSAGKSELIYRGLVGQSAFRIDVIILELDPLAAYPYRIKISEAKKTFRLANRNYQLIDAKKGALHLRIINPR